MLSLCLRSGSGCKWDVQQMEVFNGLRVIQTIFSLASKKKKKNEDGGLTFEKSSRTSSARPWDRTQPPHSPSGKKGFGLV